MISTASLRIDINIGSRNEAHHTSVGKAILAYQTETFLKQYLNSADFTPLTDNSIISPEALSKNLAEVRKNGYSYENEELEVGLNCYGAPILNREGNSVAGVSISGPVTRMRTNKIQKIAALQETARRISANLR